MLLDGLPCGETRPARIGSAARMIDIAGWPRGTSDPSLGNQKGTSMDMQERAGIVTGAASGIGKATAF
jgi:hypothetical protein